MNSTRDTYWKDFEALARRVAALERALSSISTGLDGIANPPGALVFDETSGYITFDTPAGLDPTIYVDSSNNVIAIDGGIRLVTISLTQVAGVNFSNITDLIDSGSAGIVEIPQSGGGFRLTSPDGLTTKTIQIDNSGNIVAT